MSNDSLRDDREAVADESGRSHRTGGKQNILGRRGFLKATGVGLVSTVGLSAATSAADDYDVVTVDAGSEWSHRLDDGEVFENVLFDCSASNTRVSLTATGRNWTIRNVGIEGVHDQSGGHAVLGLKAAGGTDCLVENVWMGDGSANYSGAGSSETAAWVAPDSTGTITFRHCYFEGWKDNAIYASAPGQRGNGPVVIEECYARDNNHADFRIGSTGSVVRDSVVEHTGSGSGVRGVWCWYNDGLEVRNCQIAVNGYGAAIHAGPYEPGGVNVYDSEISGSLVENGQGNGDISLVSGNGRNPEPSVPEGVPRSPEEAAGGTADGGGDPGETLPNTLLIDGSVSGPDVSAPYEFEVGGEVETATFDGANINDDTVIDGSTVTGEVHGWKDAFRFDGELVDVSLDGDATVYLDGEELEIDSKDRSLVVDGSVADGDASYEFEVSGGVEPASIDGADFNATDTIDGSSVSGGVSSGKDGYRFDGELVDFSLEGNAVVYLDGERLE